MPPPSTPNFMQKQDLDVNSSPWITACVQSSTQYTQFKGTRYQQHL